MDEDAHTQSHEGDSPAWIQAASGIDRMPRANDEARLSHHMEERLAKPIDVGKVIVLSFRQLQLQRIIDLQEKLITISVDAITIRPLPDNHASRLDEALGAYAQALRNYETLSLNALPSIPSGGRLVGSLEILGEEPQRGLRQILETRLLELGRWVFSGKEDSSSSAYDQFSSVIRRALRMRPMDVGPTFAVNIMEPLRGDVGFRELDQQGRLRRTRKKALLQRLAMGLFGGVALICPVVIMVLHPSQNTNLITVSLATIVFVMLLAVCATDSTGKDVLEATAAYAAVLVVFFGTSTGPATTS